jgi:hypothetical protein
LCISYFVVNFWLKACPNFFFKKSPQEYQDYRYYIISRLPSISILDTTPVSDEERSKAYSTFGQPTATLVQAGSGLFIIIIYFLLF